MSKIDGSGRSGQDDVTRRNREDYQKKESDLIKKHNKEVRRINELHMQDIEKMRKSNSETVQGLQKSAAKSITERDAKYRKQIDEIRRIQQKQIGALKQENQRRIELERAASKESIKVNKSSAKERIRDLKGHYESTLNTKAKNYQEKVQNARKIQSEAILKQRTQLEKKHNTKFREFSESARREKADLQYKFAEHREHSKSASRREQLKNMSTQQRISNNSMAQIKRDRAAHDDQMNVLRLGFRDSLKRTRDRFQEASDKKDRNIQSESIALKESADGRIDTQVRKLEQKIENLKTANNLERVRLKQSNKIEKANIVDSFKKNLDRYEEARLETLQQSKIQHAKDLNKLQIRNDKINDQSSKFYQQKMNEANLIHKSSYESLNNNLDTRLAQNTNSSQSRVDNIIADTNAQVERLKKNYGSSLEIMREDYEREKKNLVSDMTQEKEMSVQRLRDVIAKKEMERASKESAMVRKYENRITNLNDRIIKDKRMEGNRQRILLKQIANANKDALEAQKIQFAEKVDALKNDQRIEIARMQEKHRTQMDSVLSAMKKG